MATFTPVTDYLGNLDREALVEQLGGLVALYWGDQPAAQQIIDLCGGGQVLLWHFEPTLNLPCIALVRQGQTYFVWVAGTVNQNQWVGNVVGAVCPLQFSPTVLVHQFFWNLTQALLARLDPHLPPVGGAAQFVVVGHSLGGAVAQIIGLLLGRRYGVANVTVLGISQPKAFTLGLNPSENWKRYIRVRVPYDPVPMLPPDSDTSFFLQLVTVFAVVSTVYRWVHYGTGWLLGLDGTLVPDPPLSYWQQVPGQWLTQVRIENHLIQRIVALAASG